MRELFRWLFGLGLGGNAALFIPQLVAIYRKRSAEGVSLITFGGFSALQVVGIVHGCYERDWSLILGMAASLLTCGSLTALAAWHRIKGR